MAMHNIKSRSSLLLTSLFLFAFNPLMCTDRHLQKIQDLALSDKIDESSNEISKMDKDQAEVHLTRAYLFYQQKKYEDAKNSLDQVFRHISDAEVLRREKENHLIIKQRYHFLKGLVLSALDKHSDALVEFTQSLKFNPKDEDARWNYEYSWYKVNPPCVQREDDHEPDNQREGAPAYPSEKEKQENRILCVSQEDWYGVELQKGSILFVSVTAEVPTNQDEEVFRDLSLALYRPLPGALAYPKNDPNQPQPQPQVQIPLNTTAQVQDEPIQIFNEQLSFAQNKKTIKILEKNIDQDGIWTFQIRGNGNAELKYQVNVWIDFPCPQGEDQFEPNDEALQAKDLADGEHGPLKACMKNVDWFKVSVPANEKRQLSAGFEGDPTKLEMLIYNESGDQLLGSGNALENGVAVLLPLPSTEEPPKSTDPSQAPTPTDPSQAAATDATPAPPTQYLVKIQSVDVDLRYQLKLAPPEGDQNQDQQNQQDQKDQQDQQQQDQQQQDQQNQQNQQQQEPQQMNLEQLMDSLNENDQNPQLQKALQNLQNIPAMEDY